MAGSFSDDGAPDQATLWDIDVPVPICPYDMTPMNVEVMIDIETGQDVAFWLCGNCGYTENILRPNDVKS